MGTFHKIMRIVSAIGIAACVFVFTKIDTLTNDKEGMFYMVSLIGALIMFFLLTIFQKKADMLKSALKLIASFSFGNYFFNSMMRRPYLFSYASSINATIFKNTLVFLPLFVLLLILASNSIEVRLFFKEKLKRGRKKPGDEFMAHYYGSASAFSVVGIVFLFFGLLGAICRIFVPHPLDVANAIDLILSGQGSMLADIWDCIVNICSKLCLYNVIAGVLLLIPVFEIGIARRVRVFAAYKPGMVRLLISLVITAAVTYICVSMNFYGICEALLSGEIFADSASGYNVGAMAAGSSGLSIDKIILYIILPVTLFGSLYVWSIVRIRKAGAVVNSVFQLVMLPLHILLAMAMSVAAYKSVAAICMMVFISLVILITLALIIAILSGAADWLMGAALADNVRKYGSAYDLDPDNKEARIALSILSEEGDYAAGDVLRDYRSGNKH